MANNAFSSAILLFTLHWFHRVESRRHHVLSILPSRVIPSISAQVVCAELWPNAIQSKAAFADSKSPQNNPK